MATHAAVSGSSAVKPTDTTSVTEMERELGAAFLASGIGALVLGLMVVITEMKSIATATQNALKFVGPVGPLSGKTTVAVVAFVVSWLVLHFGLKSVAMKLTTAFVISIVLVVLGLLLTYPPVFDLFAK